MHPLCDSDQTYSIADIGDVIKILAQFVQCIDASDFKEEISKLIEDQLIDLRTEEIISIKVCGKKNRESGIAVFRADNRIERSAELSSLHPPGKDTPSIIFDLGGEELSDCDVSSYKYTNPSL